MKKHFDTEGWQYILLYFALLFCLAFTVGCKPTEQVQQPYTIVLPEGVEAPDSVNGWQVVRTGLNSYTYFPPQRPPKRVKYKNVGNTTIKDNNNTKAKGEAIIGNHNAPIEAKKHAVVGDGNTVVAKRQTEWWVWALFGLAALYFLWPVIKRVLFWKL